MRLLHAPRAWLVRLGSYAIPGARARHSNLSQLDDGATSGGKAGRPAAPKVIDQAMHTFLLKSLPPFTNDSSLHTIIARDGRNGLPLSKMQNHPRPDDLAVW